jgi:predicted mannosyl-3-phosphoglycerate phosphatase (HAD superfamily)
MDDALTSLTGSGTARESLARAEVLYTDLDGTLLGRGGSILTDLDGGPDLTAAEAVAALNRTGLPVVIVSARTACMLKEIARMLAWQDYLAEMGTVRVYGRGADVVYDLGEWKDTLTAGGVRAYDVIEESGVVAELMNAFPGALEYHAPHHSDREVTHLLRGHVDDAAAQSILDASPLPLTWLDNGVVNPRRTGLDTVEHVHAYHVMPRGVDKASAISADLARRGLTREQAVMIGDSQADLDVREAVGLTVLVANALRSESVREEAASADDVVVTEGAAGSGWAQLAHAWIAARGLA